jgi:hypothetical protein
MLYFLGAPAGFQVNWWRFSADRVLLPGAWPTRAEVNGGWTYRGTNQIWIFRDEEWDRVVLHECVHALNWDVIPDSSVQVCLQEHLGHGTLMPAIFEAATELNAEWLWCVIHSPADDAAGHTWVKQREWQKKQALAILARAGTKWEEDTSVFAYYILKAVLAEDMQRFLYGWLTETLKPDYWCDVWAARKDSLLAAAAGSTTDQNLSLRMTNPEIE